MQQFGLITAKNYFRMNESPKKGRSQTLFTRRQDIKEVFLEEFNVLKVLGRGSFGKVCLVEFTPTKEIYAMKSLKKDVLIDQDQIENTLLEKKILQSMEHPFIVGLVFCFQTEERVYFIMPFMRGGELFQHLRRFRIFDEEK
jgi:serine/threonine protein kinase